MTPLTQQRRKRNGHDGKQRYEVFAVGFGTVYSGSNFDAAWKEFERHAKAGHTVGFSCRGELSAMAARGNAERL